MFRVEFRKTLAVVDGLADDEHGGEGEMVVVNNSGEVFQLTATDALVGPGKMIAGSYGGVLRIFLKELSLDIVDDSC